MCTRHTNTNAFIYSQHCLQQHPSHLAGNGFITLLHWQRTSRGQEETLSVMKGRKGKWLPSYFVDVKLTVLRWDEVSGMCVTVACLTPEQLGICSRVFMSLSHILCCRWCCSLLPVHKHSFKYCACERSRSLNAVCVFRFHVSSDEQAQQAGRQQRCDRWEIFLLCYLCLAWVFFFLNVCTSSRQTRRGSMDLQASRS